MKPKTATDVEVLLSGVLGFVATRHVEIYKEKDKPCALIRPKHRIPHGIWTQLHRQVRKWGGHYRRAQKLWEVPLDES